MYLCDKLLGCNGLRYQMYVRGYNGTFLFIQRHSFHHISPVVGHDQLIAC